MTLTEKIESGDGSNFEKGEFATLTREQKAAFFRAEARFEAATAAAFKRSRRGGNRISDMHLVDLGHRN